MSEALDKVRGVRELPLFPLPVVLFPGMPMPLHIFEPRYRKMLADIRAGDNLYGLSYFDSAASENEIPAAGLEVSVRQYVAPSSAIFPTRMASRNTGETNFRTYCTKRGMRK